MGVLHFFECFPHDRLEIYISEDDQWQSWENLWMIGEFKAVPPNPHTKALATFRLVVFENSIGLVKQYEVEKRLSHASNKQKNILAWRSSQARRLKQLKAFQA
jgi:hypothetical protein